VVREQLAVGTEVAHGSPPEEHFRTKDAASRRRIVSYLSFPIRLWRGPSLEAVGAAPHWHAELQHIQSGESWAFHSLDELFAFVRQQVESLA